MTIDLPNIFNREFVLYEHRGSLSNHQNFKFSEEACPIPPTLEAQTFDARVFRLWLNWISRIFILKRLDSL